MELSSKKMKNILVVVAHPDDEILGCGGTIARHVDNGDQVTVMFIADGVSSRGDDQGVKKRQEASHRACELVGVTSSVYLNLPDNQLDSIPLLKIVQKIERQIEMIMPYSVYTHYAGDLNIDHAIVYRAVITACRPVPECPVKEIYSFEVASSTDWLPHGRNGTFAPNFFVDISETLGRKRAALQAYNTEMRPFPHSRSYENLEHLACYRGATVGVAAAEGFMVERILKPKL